MLKVKVDGGVHVLPRFLLVLCVPVLVVACFAFSSQRAEAEEALASWYGPGFSGLPTATGEPFDPFGYTAAHKTMPLGTELLVSYGGNAVEVRVNDRGPYVGDRELDLSQGAAQEIGLIEAGVDYVEYASVDQYAAPAYGTPATTQYAPTTEQQPEQAVTSQYAVYEDQYSMGSDTLVADASFEEPAPVAPDSASGTGVSAADPSPSDGGTGVFAGSVLVVRPGETLSGIALETGVSSEYLAEQNGIPDTNFIYAGQVLYY